MVNPDLPVAAPRLIFFPVRHHSPTCARLVRELIRTLRPDAILIEGPADYNPHMAELALPHQLPIAIYSYVRLPDGSRRGAFYPFCGYSPEWAAMRAANDLGIHSQFIDMPWADMVFMREESLTANRYADGALAVNPYVQALCREVGVDSFDDLWDTLFEIPDLTPGIYIERMLSLCHYMRSADAHVSDVDVRREAYMAEMIRAALNQYSGMLLIVTGGYHSSALIDLINLAPNPSPQTARGDQVASDSPSLSCPPHAPDTQLEKGQGGEANSEKGIALTPYSYERLDNLKGYASGMPNPGFYHEVWFDAGVNKAIYRKLLARVAKMLRERRQIVSTADLIAVESMARSLADLRGHRRVWRRDLIDGVIGALVKEEFAYEFKQPFLEAVYEVFRGHERGRLAAGTTLPPLVYQIGALLEAHDLQPAPTERAITLDLSADLPRSQILHQIRVLGLPGYAQTRALDLDSDSERVEEVWRIRWSPEFEAACIESAIYGPTLEDAARARLQERADHVAAAETPNAAQAVGLLLDAVLMGLPASADGFYTRLTALINGDGNFFTVAQALSQLLYLYRFDALLGVAGHTNTGDLLRSTFRRALWLLENLGSVTDRDRELVEGVRALLETYERCGDLLNIPVEDFAGVFERSAADTAQTPLMRGAAHGVLWTLRRVTELSGTLLLFAVPDQLGDFLTGLFTLAREVVQREPELVQQIDKLLMAYDEDSFLEALPSLRLAFSFFVPREKYYLTRTLFEDTPDVLTTPLEVSDADAARALAFENALFKAMEHYGVLND